MAKTEFQSCDYDTIPIETHSIFVVLEDEMVMRVEKDFVSVREKT